MARGHGPAVYGYGWGWFTRCLEAAGAAEAAAGRKRRRERAGTMADIRVAVHGDKECFVGRCDALAGE